MEREEIPGGAARPLRFVPLNFYNPHSHLVAQRGNLYFHRDVDMQSEPRRRVYIDDSGCGGMKLEKGSTRSLVMAGVAFESADDLAALANEFDAARERLHFRREFKNQQLSKRQRAKLFEYIEDIPFSLRCIMAMKSDLTSDVLRASPPKLKAYLLAQLITHHRGNWAGARLNIDGQDTRGFEYSDANYFMQRSDLKGGGFAHSIRFVDSTEHVGIQLADICAGVIRWMYEGDRHVPDRIRKVITDRCRQPSGTWWDFTQTYR